MKKLIALIAVFAVVFCFTGCFPQSTVEFNIKFIVDGEVYAAVATNKNTIKMPADPKKDGYEFDGWFWDKDVWGKPFTLNSLMDAPLSETLRVYAKFTGGLPVESTTVGKLYSLQKAYDLDLLTYKDICDIAFYHQGQPPWMSAIYTPYTSKTPEFLSAETENKIKQTFLDDYYSYSGSYGVCTINDVRITNYYGTYNKSVAVYLDGLYEYSQAERDVTVAGVPFHYSNGNSISVWTEDAVERNCIHEWACWDLESLPLCWEGELQVADCRLCGAIKTETIVARHEWDPDVSAVEMPMPKCIEQSISINTCLLCGAHQTLTIPAMKRGDANWKYRHHWEWVITTPATPTSDGIETKTCIYCGKTKGTRIIHALPEPGYREADLVSKYSLSIKVNIWNDYMPPVIPDANSICVVEIIMPVDDVVGCTIPKFEISAVVVTARVTIQIDKFVSSSGYRPAQGFRLSDGEEYVMYLTLKCNGEIQTVPIAGSVFVTH